VTTEKQEVLRLLVTGSDDLLGLFQLCVCNELNAISRRRQTVFYTCMSHSLDPALELARHLGVGVQQVERAGEDESYRTLVEPGEGGGLWSPGRKGVRP
jgi:hypothetical protein